jgi:hypothetical protein
MIPHTSAANLLRFRNWCTSLEYIRGCIQSLKPEDSCEKLNYCGCIADSLEIKEGHRMILRRRSYTSLWNFGGGQNVDGGDAGVKCILRVGDSGVCTSFVVCC